MADNDTTGTGKAVATDKVTYSGDADQNVQLVRWVQVTGAEGSKTVVDGPGTGATNLGKAEDAAHVSGDTGVYVLGVRQAAIGPLSGTDGDYESFQMDANGQLKVIAASRKAIITATLTRPSDTTAYAADDAVSSSTSAPTISTFTGCARATGLGGTILGCVMTDSAYSATPGQYDLWLLDTTTTPTNDNTAFAPSDADANTLVAVIPLNVVSNGTKTAGTGGNMVFTWQGIRPFVTAGSANLFGLLVVRNAYTPISAEVFQIRLIIEQD